MIHKYSRAGNSIKTVRMLDQDQQSAIVTCTRGRNNRFPLYPAMRASAYIYEEECNPISACPHRANRHHPTTTKPSHKSSGELRCPTQGCQSLVNHDRETPACRRLSLSKDCVCRKKN